ncbi:SH3 domain-containing protein [Pseudenhygromyxa sp. WMMC2535]|uniref:NlpC/P60 family protein n=1 Tax=Pseudenhygromyxa sp. WMMC2535 TaxID=2712867 RepID=UPI001557ED98|nr:NlpC/P60 family protein [Pseudenhygromyxa sp. WMMC2535]NVB42579.1 SH3 domain-containing protein [Pseudenhygromyxa sp. WMMC2535]
MTSRPRAARWRLATALAVLSGACGGSTPESARVESAPFVDDAPAPGQDADPRASADDCPSAPIPETRAPDVRPELERAEFWLAKLPPEAADRPLLDDDERRELAAQVRALPGGWREVTDPSLADPDHVHAELDERLAWLRGRVDEGKYVETSPGALAAAAATVRAAELLPEGGSVHDVLRETPLWCVPTTAGLYTEPVDLDFDRNRCASLHLGELVRVIARGPEARWLYVDAGHSVGWIRAEDSTGQQSVGPAVSDEALRARAALPQLWLFTDALPLRAGSHFPLAEGSSRAILLPTPEGPTASPVAASVAAGDAPLPFTRRQLFTQALAQLDDPYGWGGRAGLRDCSRYLMDLFAQFDLRLPRNSAVQSRLGTRSVDVSELDEQAKREAIHAAAERGVVLLYMPGHIMLYLGEDGGHDYGVSAIGEWLEPCPGGADTVHQISRVALTTLELGRGSERRAFIERITRLAVFE